VSTQALRKRYVAAVALAAYRGGLLRGWVTTWEIIQRQMWGGRYPTEETSWRDF